MRLTLWTGFWVFLADQATKYIVVHALGLMERLQIEVIPGILEFRMAWNRGVNFGLFAGFDMRWALIGLALAISGAVLAWIARDGGGRLALVSAGLLVGGALGNVVDRVLYGAVADFLNVSCCGISNPYAFNIADIAIFVGAVGLVMFGGDKTRPERGPGRGGKGRSGHDAKNP
ncbi:signal peptidase II [Limimaricola hongkongensis]|uniref:Lipoprotein signal peptidase n=1 Tax=Limimaricola hongkongensis DSM 17492 TaxID=1122180 RepID=A0A017HF82_9RHOB|nr:signal peptidase II [Limimaricola hongkongensis]EYD73006.1 Lipoprotein signal peptidase [Limimaricola hongkongensis DSM 17492]